MPNYYEILGVAQAATPEEIKNSYKKLALKWHPDKNLDNKEEAEKRFKEINDSYQILINSESRAIYDDRGESWREFLKMETYSSEELRKKDKEKRFQKTVQETTMLIFSEFASHSQIGEEDLDPSLWNGYSDWLEKVQSLKDSDSLLFFEKQLISAIRGKSRERKNDLIKQEAIERIEEKLNWNKDKLTFKDLREENRNYWEQIKSVTNDEIHWKVKDIENRVKENIDQQIIVKSSNQVSQVAPNFERSREREQKKVNYNKSVVSAQSWLDKAYPMSWGLLSERRNQIREVEITEKNLWGYLDLSEFINLEWLYCEKNRLTQLILPINNNLQTLVIQDNLLTNIDFSALNAKNLSFLDLTNNNFSSRDLSFFAKLRQLKELHLGNRDKEKIDQGTYNRWFGSLKPLQSLIKLEVLDISNTDINSGLEYLPNSIKIIYCSNQERPDSQVKKIADQLKGYYTEKGYYDLASWRKDIFSSTMNFSSLKKELEREKEKSNKLAEENQSLSEVNKYFENSLIEKEREAKSLNESLKLEKEKSNNFEKQLKEEKTLNESLQNYVREAKIEIPPKK